MKAVLDHVGIAVQDVERALAFYRDALGLDVHASEEVLTQRVRAHFIPVGGSSLELLEGTAPDSAITRYIEKRGPGLHHICFEVEDVEKSMRYFEGKGGAFLEPNPRPGAGSSRSSG